MDKLTAIQMLGGTVKAAAEACGITHSAVSQWPDKLTPAIENRVLAALYRKGLGQQAGATADVATRDAA